MPTSAKLAAIQTTNPYAPPRVLEPIGEAARPENPHGFLLRTGVYFLTSVALYLAFCSPLDFFFAPAFQRDAASSGKLLMAVIGSSLVAGWVFDPLVRLKYPTAIIGPAYMLLNSMLFVFLDILLAIYEDPVFSNNFTTVVLASVVYGPIGCILCIHLVGPICCGAIYWAGQLVDSRKLG